MIPKAIDGKCKSNKVIKLLANMDTFAQSDYEYDSLHILIKKIVVFPEKGLEFTMLDGSIIKITYQDTDSLTITDERKPQAANT